MGSPTAGKIHKFGDLFFSILNIEFVRRKAPGLPVQLGFTAAIFFGIVTLFVLNIGFAMVFVTFARGKHYATPELSAAGEGVSVYFITMFRGYTLLANRQKINRLLIELEKLFPATRKHQLEFRLHYYTNLIVARNKTMKTLTTASLVGYLSMPLLQSIFSCLVLGKPFVYRVPFFCWYPFNEQQLPWYPFVYVFQIVTAVFAVLFYVNEDFIFSSAVTQICMHYEYLCTLVGELDARDEAMSTSGLRTFVCYQHAVERLLTDVNQIFSMSTFVGFTTIKMTICAYFFSMFYGNGVIDDLRSVLCVMTLSVSIYQRCSSGERIFEASAGVLNAIYNHNWYEASPRYRKTVVIMMIRANRPMSLEASTLRQLSMEYFQEIVMETYQIFTFLFNFSH